MASRAVEEVLRYDATQAQAALRETAAAAEQAAVAARQVQVAALGITDTERGAAAALRQSAAAETLRAETLGISVGQLRQIQVAEAAVAAEREKAAAAARQTAVAWTAQGTAADRLGNALGAGVVSLRQDGEAHADAARNTKSHAAAVTNLRFQLSDIATSLAGGMSPGMILAQQGPQVAEALAAMDGGIKGVAASISAMAIPAAVLVVGLGAIAAVCLSVTREIRLEAEAHELAAAVAASHTSALRANENAHLDLLVASGEISAAFAKETRAAYDARDAVKAYAAAQEGQRAELASRAESDARLLSYSSIFKIGEDASGQGGYGPGQLLDVLSGASDDLDATRKSVGALNSALVDQAAIIKTGREEVQKTAIIEEDEKARKDALTDSTKLHTSAIRDAKDATKEYTAALKANESYQYDIGLGAGTPGMSFDAFTSQQRAAALTQWADMQSGNDSAAYDVGLGYSTVPAPQVSGSGIASVAGVVSGGALAGEAAVFAIIEKLPFGKMLSLLTTIAMNTGDFLDGINSVVTRLTANLGNLGGDIKDFKVGVVETLIPSLIEALPAFIEGMLVDLTFGLIKTFADPSFWVNIVTGLGVALKESFTEIWKNTGKEIAEAIRSILKLGDGEGFSPIRGDDGRLFGGIRGNISGENRTGTHRQIGEGFGDLMSGRATWSLFRRTNGEQRVGGGVVLGRIGDIFDSFRRDSAGRNLDAGT